MADETTSGHRQRLRERYLRAGFRGFSNHEIVELILTLSIPRGDVKPQAKRLIKHFGSLRKILDAPLEELQAVEGLGAITAINLRILRDSANLYLQQSLEEEEALNSTAKIEAFCMSRLAGLKHEVFEVLYLDKRYRIMADGVERIEEGGADSAPADPKKIMARAITRHASSVILVHNHPAGTPKPSTPDIQLTRSVMQAGEAVGVNVMDHIIVAGDQVYSFRANKLIK